MTTMNVGLVALAVGLSAVAFASPVSAQGSARDAAIEKCVAMAHAEAQTGGADERRRTEIYKSCMVSAGQDP